MDQDYVTMTRMKAARSYYNALYRFTHAVGDQIHQLTEGERELIYDLMQRRFI